MRKLFIFCDLVLLLFATQLSAEPGAILVELKSDTSAIKPGEPFLLGAYFVIQDPWHIYWKYPGEAGLPTKVEVSVPEDFKIEPLDYPTPIQFDQDAGLVGYGYQGELMLLFRITPPQVFSDREIRISAKAKWLGCYNVCVPGKRNDLRIVLPISRENQELDNRLFTEWQARIPVALDDRQAVLTGVVERVLQGRENSYRFTPKWNGVKGQLTNWMPALSGGLKLTKSSGQSSDEMQLSLAGGEVDPKLKVESVISYLLEGHLRGLRVLLP